MRWILWKLAYIVLGACVFWIPDTILHALQSYVYSRFAGSITKGIIGMILFFILPQVLLPVLSVAAALQVWRLGKNRTSLATISFSFLLGVWLLGPFFMTINASFTGGGFSRPDGWHLVQLGTLLFPVFTFIMATYDGSLFGLLLATLLLILTAVELVPKVLQRFITASR